MINKIKTIIPDCNCNNNNCIEKTGFLVNSLGGFGITDSNPNSPIKITSKNSCCTIINQTGKEIHILKTDQCLFPDNVSKCDCILLNEEKIILVEIKNCNPSTRKKHRIDAIHQLENTISILEDLSINDLFKNKVAIICFPVSNKIINTSSSTKVALFAEKYGYKLSETTVVKID